MKRVGRIQGAEFDGTECPTKIGEKTAAAYIAFRDGLGLKPLADYNIAKADAIALAKDVSVECFAPLTPRKATEEDAKALLEKVFS